MSMRPGSVGHRVFGCSAPLRVAGGVARGGGRALRGVALLLLVATGAAACAKDNGGAAAQDSASADSVPGLPGSAREGAGGDSGEGGAVAKPVAAGGARVVLFVGTSLTAGLGLDPDSAYPALIQQKIDSAGLPFRAVNAGVSGETTAALLRRLDWLLRQPAAVIVVESGANDGLRGIPVETARENLGEVLRRVRAAQPEARVVLAQMEAPPNLGRRYASAFHAMYGELAKTHGAVLMPFLLEGVAGESGLNQADGIHPNAAGERIVAANVWRVVGPVLAGVR